MSTDTERLAREAEQHRRHHGALVERDKQWRERAAVRTRLAELEAQNKLLEALVQHAHIPLRQFTL